MPELRSDDAFAAAMDQVGAAFQQVEMLPKMLGHINADGPDAGSQVRLVLDVMIANLELAVAGLKEVRAGIVEEAQEA